MNVHTQPLTLVGAAGPIEAARDPALPSCPAQGVVVIAHPHPLYGGTMQNKVVQTLARAFVCCGYTAVRFNFRGVGQSAGSYDEGRGELDDLLSVLRQVAPEGPLALAGFSFGAFVTSQALAFLADQQRSVQAAVLVGTAASRFDVAPIAGHWHERTLIVHGEQDETVPLASVMDWARPQHLPVTVVPGCGHFFHGQLPLLKNVVTRHLHALRAQSSV